MNLSAAAGASGAASHSATVWPARAKEIAQARPMKLSGYAQGLSEISNSDGLVIFRGRYYDSGTIRSSAGDEALTVVGQTVVDHWENGFGEGPYAGHAFSVGVQLIQEGEAPLRGEGRGHID